MLPYSLQTQAVCDVWQGELDLSLLKYFSFKAITAWMEELNET